MSAACAFSVAEKSLFRDRRVQHSLLVEGRLAVPLYFIDGFHHRGMSQTVDDSVKDRKGLAKNGSVHYWARVDGGAMISKQTNSVWEVSNIALSAEKPIIFFDRSTTFVSCCRLFAQGCYMDRKGETVLAGLTRDVQQYRLLCSIESRQASCFCAVAVGRTASEKCYAVFTCV